MNAGKIKDAVMTTVVVLGVTYAMNQVSMTRGLVQKALNG